MPKRKIRYEGEYDRHFKQKIRVARIFVTHGWFVQVEKQLPCYLRGVRETYKLRYRADIFAIKGNRKVIAEIDGKFHSTKQAKDNQYLRLIRIRERYGKGIEEYRFTFKRLARWKDKEIAEEMRL